MKCYFLDHHRYINHTEIGYLVKPCCRARTNNQNVKNIEDLENNNYLQEIKQSLLQDKKHSACIECWQKEELGLQSKRQEQEHNLKDAKGIEDWDIRPGNTCNLKCIMCGPHQSSKWFEDIDIYNSTFNQQIKKIKSKELDWEYITENTINKANRIYIAGGEPFYMKNVINFLDKLSHHKWNRNFTFIELQTNGISFNNRVFDILGKFKKQHIGFSIDGWGKVNEIIRYPTVWKDLYNNYLYLKCRYIDNNKSISINITISALNLPVVNQMLIKFRSTKINLNELYHPSILHINSLHPNVIDKVSKSTSNLFVLDLIKRYEFDQDSNEKMKKYLADLDAIRGTNSKDILPWCWE